MRKIVFSIDFTILNNHNYLEKSILLTKSNRGFVF